MKIAVLTSTRPLRDRVMEAGREVETLSVKKLAALAEEYDLVIIGSRASDELFDRIEGSLPRTLAEKLRLYSRGFFDRFKRSGALPSAYDDRDEGWKEILTANGINFVSVARLVGGNFRSQDTAFRWGRLDRFIRDDRVTVIK
jgi:hypothetical protein